MNTLLNLATLLPLIIYGLLLSGCQSFITPTQSPPFAPLKHLYDFQIIDTANQHPLDIKSLAQKLHEYDVIFIGEYHGNHASHLLEMQLLAELHHNRRQQVLSMEMFNRDQQAILNQYLDSAIGEAYLINKAPAWDNYKASYRPLIEYAKQHFIPVIAANAPSKIVHCVGREGRDFLTQLSAKEQQLIAALPLRDDPEYRQRYMEFLDHARRLSEKRKQSSYLAQLTRDNTMADSIHQAWLNHPKHQIVHINGSFHSDYYSGTVSALKALNPELKVAVISPVIVEDPQKPDYLQEDLVRGDLLYFVQAQPTEYQNAEYKRQARQRLFKQADQTVCH